MVEKKDIEVTAPQTPIQDTEAGIVKDVKNADAALDFLRHQGEAREMTAEDEKRLVRKIDYMIMPLMFGCYCLQYLDKTLINYAAVMGLEDDANMTGNQFSTLALIFYVSYLAVEFPHGYGMQRLPTAKYLGTMVTLWVSDRHITRTPDDPMSHGVNPRNRSYADSWPGIDRYRYERM
jgi:hypothetical protein